MAHTFIDAVLFAEFDIDKGSVLRQQYPRKVTDDEGLMAELMIPEGIHNHFQDWTVFMLNRPTQPPKQAAAPRKWPVQAYKYEGVSPSGQWVLASGGGADATHFAQVNGAAAQAGGKRTEAHVVVDLGQGKTMRLQSHDELGLQYAALQPDFASMWTVDGQAVGLHFRSGAQQEEFKEALDAASTASSAASSNVLWCLNHVSSRRDNTVRRGAQVKALAVCSRFQFVRRPRVSNPRCVSLRVQRSVAGVLAPHGLTRPHSPHADTRVEADAAARGGPPLLDLDGPRRVFDPTRRAVPLPLRGAHVAPHVAAAARERRAAAGAPADARPRLGTA